jgi:hypothetical protein
MHKLPENIQPPQSLFENSFGLLRRNEVVAGAGIEPATQGFSVPCPTN